MNYCLSLWFVCCTSNSNYTNDEWTFFSFEYQSNFTKHQLALCNIYWQGNSVRESGQHYIDGWTYKVIKMNSILIILHDFNLLHHQMTISYLCIRVHSICFNSSIYLFYLYSCACLYNKIFEWVSYIRNIFRLILLAEEINTSHDKLAFHKIWF